MVEHVGERLKGHSILLLLLCLGMSVVGVLLPSAPIEAEAASIKPAQPFRLVVPEIDVRAKVIPVQMTGDGVLHPPEDTDVVGWWKGSAMPARDDGQTLLTGHTVSSGGGVMNRMGDLEEGDRVRVRTKHGAVDYETTRVATYSVEQLADKAEALFGQGRKQNRLVLVTCTDWDGEVYRSNIVAFADPVEEIPRRG